MAVLCGCDVSWLKFSIDRVLGKFDSGDIRVLQDIGLEVDMLIGDDFLGTPSCFGAGLFYECANGWFLIRAISEVE